MLRANVHVSAAAAKGYYTEGLSRQDYYSEGQEIIGQWGGQGAEKLGLTGQVERAAFARLCENLHPVTGKQLTPRSRVNRRVGYDFNFHCPKSVSVLQAFTGDARIVDAFRAAVNETMCDLERGMNTRIRRAGARAERATGNIAWGEFVHLTGRPVGGIPDPHLHAHCFVFNATFDPVEKRWKAGEFAGIKADLEYYEALFHSRLAGRLQGLGYAVERHGKGWEIAGIGPAVVKQFSRRTAQIEAIAAKRGITDAKLKDQLGAKCRERKQKEVPFSGLLKLWEERLTPLELQSLRGLGGSVAVPSVTPDGARTAVGYALDHGFARNSVIGERKLQALAIRRAIGTAGASEVEQELQNAGLLRRVVAGRAVVTTRKILAEEERLTAFAESRKGTERPLAADYLPRRSFLSLEQKAAVEHVLRSKDRVIAIRGGAGTGKTTLMTEAVEGITSTGKRVFTFAPTAIAARKVLREEGFADAETVARLLQDEKLQAKLKNQVVWIDEAGLLSVRDLLGVFRVADQQNARVVLSGDTRQHSAVERGDALRILERSEAVVPAEVNEIRRQRGDYRRAVEAISQGDLEGAFRILDDLRAVREVAPGQVAENVAEAYVKSIDRGRTALVVSPTHREGAEVTESIRARLKTARRLGGSEREVYQQINLNWTEAEKTDAAHYQPGDVIQFVQNTSGFSRGERVVVAGRDATGALACNSLAGVAAKVPFRPEHPSRFQVYRQSSLPLAVGEKIRVTQGGYTKNRCRLENGAVYTVKGFGHEGVECDNGFKIPWDYGNLAYGYVTTSHAAQGRTVDDVLIAQTAESAAAASREQFYVSASRGRARVLVYTDDKRSLMEVVDASRARVSASDLLKPKSEKMSAFQDEPTPPEQTSLPEQTPEERAVAEAKTRQRAQEDKEREEQAEQARVLEEAEQAKKIEQDKAAELKRAESSREDSSRDRIASEATQTRKKEDLAGTNLAPAPGVVPTPPSQATTIKFEDKVISGELVRKEPAPTPAKTISGEEINTPAPQAARQTTALAAPRADEPATAIDVTSSTQPAPVASKSLDKQGPEQPDSRPALPVVPGMMGPYTPDPKGPGVYPPDLPIPQSSPPESWGSGGKSLPNVNQQPGDRSELPQTTEKKPEQPQSKEKPDVQPVDRHQPGVRPPEVVAQLPKKEDDPARAQARILPEEQERQQKLLELEQKGEQMRIKHTVEKIQRSEKPEPSQNSPKPDNPGSSKSWVAGLKAEPGGNNSNAPVQNQGPKNWVQTLKDQRAQTDTSPKPPQQTAPAPTPKPPAPTPTPPAPSRGR